MGRGLQHHPWYYSIIHQSILGIHLVLPLALHIDRSHRRRLAFDHLCPNCKESLHCFHGNRHLRRPIRRPTAAISNSAAPGWLGSPNTGRPAITSSINRESSWWLDLKELFPLVFPFEAKWAMKSQPGCLSLSVLNLGALRHRPRQSPVEHHLLLGRHRYCELPCIQNIRYPHTLVDHYRTGSNNHLILQWRFYQSLFW